ncbi:hypothetical protein [Rhodanobacter lindaniclasticus]
MRITAIVNSAALGCLALTLLGGCGKTATPTASASPAAATPSAATGQPAATDAPAAPAPAAAPAGSIAARTGELTNPDNSTMVFLYYDLAGIPPPIDQWVEQSAQVSNAPGADKAAQRVAVKAAFETGLASVRGVGVIHLTTQATLSAYDPTYGEFTLSALSPGSSYTFQAQNQTVDVKFDNGLAAQTWSVPKDQAQAIADKTANAYLTLDVTLKVEKVLPGPAGGTLVTHVVSWNLRNARDGTTVARVQVPAT